MKNEAAFSTWLRKQFYAVTNGQVVVQRIETTTGNGVPDLLIITPQTTYLIETKYETTNLRPMQKAWHTKVESVLGKESQHTKTLVMCAYPKTKRLVTFTVKGTSETFPLTRDGFKEFYGDSRGLKPSCASTSSKLV
jgi:hypothetical protein